MANLIFDYDGTLHQTMLTYAPAFRATCRMLAEKGYLPERDYTDEEISYWLGFNSTDMWNTFLPDLPDDIKKMARVFLGKEMGIRVDRGEAALFLHTEEVLAELKAKGHTLIFLSNCRVRYMERHTKIFGLDRYFDYFYCCEEYDFIPKYQIFRLFCLQHKGEFIVIGDRFHDIETAEKNGLKSIGCGYGYGRGDELSAADIIVEDITEIPAAVEKLLL